MRSFFNTTREKDPVLQQMEQKAKSQEQMVLLLFQHHRSMGASQCWSILHGQWLRKGHSEGYAPPITSIRRAITNLANQGKLSKSNKKVLGVYGRPEFIYELTN